MKILLLGELSGIHQELAPSLRALGHDVTIGHSRSAYPGFASDIPFFRPPPGPESRWTVVRDIASQLYNAPKLAGFDIVQIMTPKFFNWKIHGPGINFLKAGNRRLVVVHTSCTSDYYRRVAELAYRPCKECLADDKLQSCFYDRDEERRAVHVAFEAANAIVATSYEYVLSLADTPFSAKVVGLPTPVDTDRHRPSPMPPMDRIRIWYGETRHGFKGGPFIVPALDMLERSKFADRLEIIRTGRLPFDQYLDQLHSVHIVIDQASSFAAGMNALYAAACGRVTLSGAEPESSAFAGVAAAENPIVNIKPDADQIYRALSDLVSDPAKLPELGRKSAEYIAKFHSAKVIAGRYVDLYRRLLEMPAQQSLPHPTI